MAVAAKDRHSRERPCLICGGHVDMPQGKGIRCAGFRSGDFEHCQREQYAGQLPPEPNTQPTTFVHWLAGPCKCGATHTVEAHRNGSRPQGSRQRAKSPGSRPQQASGATFAEEWGRTPKKEWTFVDPFSGAPIAVHGRWEKPATVGKAEKTYRWRMPDHGYEQGLTAFGLSSTDPAPLYADELVLLPPDKPVCVCEGEPATDAVRERGLFATCWPGGSGQTEFKAEWLELFRGRIVYLWPDNDPKGATHMAALKAALVGIAKQVVYIGPTGGQRDDAVDYFAAGGTLEDRLKDVLTAPQVQVIAADHVRMRLPSPAGPVVFDFDGLRAERRGMNANLTVSMKGKEDDWEAELSLNSMSARTEARRALDDMFGKEPEFAKLTNTAWSLVKQAWRSIDISHHISETRKDTDVPWLVDWLVLERACVVFFGRGSALKGYFTNALELAVATGATEFLGHRIQRQAPVLIVDYEDPETTWLRLSRLARGEGMDEQIIDDMPIRVLDPEGVILVDLVDRLELTARRMTEQYGSPPLLVIDSAIYACPEPSKEWSVGPFFRAIRRLNLPTVVIAHTGWAQLEKGEGAIDRPYGHPMWDTAPRRTFHFRRDNDEDRDVIVTRVRNAKSNGKKSAPFAVEFSFTGTSGPIQVRRLQGRATTFEDETPVLDQVERVLRQAKKALTKYEIQERCPGTPDVKAVQTALQTGKRAGWATIDEGGRGQQTKWKYQQQIQMDD